MISDVEDNMVMMKIEKGEDISESLNEIIEDYAIFSGIVVFGIGMIRDLEIGYWNGKEYVREKLPEPGELVSFHGSISSNEPKLHIHTAIAMSDHTVKGGHFFSGVADPLMEVHIVRFKELVLKREKNNITGLTELNFD
ncbi:MAG: DUF296 domain-containing protein [Candidatus Thermoplasmatota archaeon]|jgi:predicted DNA-binding protein with PD1-like motif|nr:DUF296 domain-containing protein [Candidatus Thermoplasmatota archaeon]